MNTEKMMPEEPTDEMIRCMLAVEMPTTFKEYLRHPANGPKTAAQTEKMIQKAIRQYKAAWSAWKG